MTAAKPGGDTSYEFHGTHPYKGRYWAYSRENMENYLANGRLVFPKSGGPPSYKRYLDEMAGVTLQNEWDDIRPVPPDESLGYQTQKPLALLERIIKASSLEGDTVLDPFCGCGTAVHAAQRLNRRRIGIDITCLAIGLIERRLKRAFGKDCIFAVHGTPKDLESAQDLAKRDKYQFQWWAVTLVDAQPYRGKKKGADTGIDGLKYFYDLHDKESRKIVLSVKGGAGLKADDLRALNHVREREKAEIGILISLAEPTNKMRADAASVGFYVGASEQRFPRIQLLTIEGLLSSSQRAEHPDYVPDLNYKKPKREKSRTEQKFFEESPAVAPWDGQEDEPG